MAVELWPPIAPHELKKAEEDDLQREVKWLVEEIHETLQIVRHGLEDCYALLAPIDPGSTLPLTTPGKEFVKGTVHIRLRTLPPQTLTIDPAHPIHVNPLLTLTNLVNQAIDMLTLTLSVPINAHFMNAQLRLFASLIADAGDIIKGPPPIPASRDWTHESVSPLHFSPPMGAQQTYITSNSVFSGSGSMRGGGVFGGGEKEPPCPPMSMHIGLRDGNLMLYIRALEPVDQHVGFGTKLALAIGTTRRLEHDEADRVFSFAVPSEPYRPGSSASVAGSSSGGMATSASMEMSSGGGSGSATKKKMPTMLSVAMRKASVTSLERKKELEVYVREKVEVTTGDPSLISVQLKLNDIGHKVALARRNLAAALGEDDPED
ncbi:RAVE subunit 2/Rogdi [Zalerion maritima]|uniref:RAVE subunit 2/Rogdi n=1 Tax=Zalerion maritima TaxID=339359 RepID=A0AAD5WQJ3_9PEZI|nr:RAVE subunit 2/Rogdi [Zalerion maritima]